MQHNNLKHSYFQYLLQGLDLELEAVNNILYSCTVNAFNSYCTFQ